MIPDTGYPVIPDSGYPVIPDSGYPVILIPGLIELNRWVVTEDLMLQHLQPQP